MIQTHLVLHDNIPGCDFFKWHEVLYLNQWQICMYPNVEEATNLIKISQKLDWIRKYFGRPIKITSGIRPRIYNMMPSVGGAKKSAHMTGEALDFTVLGIASDTVRAQIEPMLSHLEIRMENLFNSNWTHIDIKPPMKSGRFFTP